MSQTRVISEKSINIRELLKDQLYHGIPQREWIVNCMVAMAYYGFKEDREFVEHQVEILFEKVIQEYLNEVDRMLVQ